MSEKEVEILPLYYDYIIMTNYPVYILVGGRNSGKSYFVEQYAVIKMHNKKKYKLLVVEDVEVNVGEGVKAGIESRIEDFDYNPVFKSVKQPPTIKHLTTGSNVIFKGYHNKKQQKQVKSINEVTAAWYEEAENITYEQFKALRMQLRGGDSEDRQLFLTMNPVNEEGFICQEFFKPLPDEVFERFSDGRAKVFVKRIKVELEENGVVEIVEIPCMVIVSTHWDNPYLTKEQRADIEELQYKDPDLYAMLAEGKFVKKKGVYFNEFEKHIHVIDSFVIPKEWRRYRTIDYGLDMLACYWIAVDFNGKAYVYKELYQSDLIISKAAKRILELTKDDEDIYQTFAPPDLWKRRQETGKSASELFMENGVFLTQASNNRVQGWLNLKEWLDPYKDEQEIMTADLVIANNCENLIRTLPQLLKDEKDPNDVALEPHELTHAPDAIRYFIAGRPAPTIKKKPDNIYNFEFEKPKPNPLGKGNKQRVI